MKIFATAEFRAEYEKLIRNKSYRYISEKIIEQYIDCSIEETMTGTKLNGSSPNPFIKKRIGGSGGSRLYYVVVPDKNSIYLGFIHPKSSPGGYENVSNEKKTKILDAILDSISSGDLLEVTCCAEKKNLIFQTPAIVVQVVA